MAIRITSRQNQNQNPKKCPLFFKHVRFKGHEKKRKFFSLSLSLITDSFHFHHYSVTSSSAPLFDIIVCGGSKRLKRISITWEISDMRWVMRENRNTNPNNEPHISLVCQKDFNPFYIFSKISLLHIILIFTIISSHSDTPISIYHHYHLHQHTLQQCHLSFQK